MTWPDESWLTTASCSRSSSRVAVVERSQLYFFFIFSCIFFILSWASFTSAKNYKDIVYWRNNVILCSLTINRCLWLLLLEFIFNSITAAYLVVGCVFFEMSLNATTELKDPAPLSLQGCSEGLQKTDRRHVGRRLVDASLTSYSTICGIQLGTKYITSTVFLPGCPSLTSLSPMAWISLTFFSRSSSSRMRPWKIWIKMLMRVKSCFSLEAMYLNTKSTGFVDRHQKPTE